MLFENTVLISGVVKSVKINKDIEEISFILHQKFESWFNSFVVYTATPEVREDFYNKCAREFRPCALLVKGYLKQEKFTKRLGAPVCSNLRIRVAMTDWMELDKFANANLFMENVKEFLCNS